MISGDDKSPDAEENLPSNGRGWLLWIFFGLVPIPIGLLLGPEKIFNSIQSRSDSLGVAYLVIAGICSLICGIGQIGGFRTGKILHIFGGIAAAILIVIFNFSVVFCVGCCSAFSRI